MNTPEERKEAEKDHEIGVAKIFTISGIHTDLNTYTLFTPKTPKVKPETEQEKNIKNNTNKPTTS